MKSSNKKESENESSSIIDTIKNFFLENYEPSTDPCFAEFHFTTLEIYSQLLRIIPDKNIFTPADVAM